MRLHQDRRRMFESIGRGLAESLNTASSGKTDRTIQGRAGDQAFRNWLSQHLPKRFEVGTGAVVSPKEPLTSERDCVIFDAAECAPFRVSGGVSDIFPIEGIPACIELNTGKSGTTLQKIKHDAEKVSEIGKLRGTRKSPGIKWLSQIPTQADLPRLRTAVEEEAPMMPPLLLIFVETLRGRLDTLAYRIAEHNKHQSIESSVDGVFVLNKGVVLHADSSLDKGWSHQRQPGQNLVYMESANWEVLLIMMMIIWNHLWKGQYITADLGRYYMDLDYFLEAHRNRITPVGDNQYISQPSKSIPVVGEQIEMRIQLVSEI